MNQLDPSDAEIEAGNIRADELFQQLLDEEPDTAFYGLWVWLTHYLVETGWTLDELQRDLAHHAHHHNSAGSA